MFCNTNKTNRKNFTESESVSQTVSSLNKIELKSLNRDKRFSVQRTKNETLSRC